jgi:protein TonB
MTGQSQTRSGGLSATRAVRDSASSAADLSKVIPFARARRTGAEPYAPPVIVKPADRPAPLPRATKPWLQGLLVVLSLIAHGGVLYLFWQEPQLLPGTGSQGMTVEIIIGDNRPLGRASTAGEVPKEGDHVEDVRPEKEADEDQRVAEARDIKAEDTRAEITKAQPLEQPSEKEPDQRQVIAMVETPQAEIPTVRPREIPPDVPTTITVTKEQPVEVKPDETKLKRRDEGREVASGSGVSIQSEANYLGRVSAHLKRHQQYPTAARAKRITGVGTVSFSIDERGRVTSASVVTTSGSVLLDEEMTAMALRASPFPASPDGRPRTFDVPVTFKLVAAGAL